jgi:hypothetical protein
MIFDGENGGLLKRTIQFGAFCGCVLGALSVVAAFGRRQDAREDLRGWYWRFTLSTDEPKPQTIASVPAENLSTLKEARYTMARS